MCINFTSIESDATIGSFYEQQFSIIDFSHINLNDPSKYGAIESKRTFMNMNTNQRLFFIAEKALQLKKLMEGGSSGIPKTSIILFQYYYVVIKSNVRLDEKQSSVCFFKCIERRGSNRNKKRHKVIAPI